MKKILIAIDYNHNAQKIVETGFAYASAMNAEICIVHAIADAAYYSMGCLPVMGFEGVGADCAFNSLRDQEEEANRFLMAVVKHLGDSSIKTNVIDGKTAEAILTYAFAYKADLLVMGVESPHGLEKITMGDVVAKILKRATMPVLIVPADKPSLQQIANRQQAYQYI